MKLTDSQPKCDSPPITMERFWIILMFLIPTVAGDESDIYGLSINDKYDGDNVFQYLVDDLSPPVKEDPQAVMRDIIARNREKFPMPRNRGHGHHSIVIEIPEIPEIPDYTDYFTSALGSLIEDLDDAAGILGSAAGSLVSSIDKIKVPDIAIGVGDGGGHGHRMLELTSADISKEEFLKRLWFRISGTYAIPETVVGRSKNVDADAEEDEDTTNGSKSKVFTEIGNVFSQKKKSNKL